MTIARALTTALFASTLVLPALAQEVSGSDSTSGNRSQIPNLEGASPSNVPDQLQDPEAANITITANIVEPEQVEPTAERLAQLDMPDGFSIAVFADGLENPRMIDVADDGTVYVTRRDNGDVMMLKDEDGDGTAEVRQVVAEKPQMHGIAVDGDTVYLMAVNEVWSAPIEEDGTFGTLEQIADGFPEGGQHPNRTLVKGPDENLYVSVGSTCNACDETSDENATMVRMSTDGTNREIFASGLRNTIGFGFEPETGALYGFDHGIDWLGDDEQPEELNRIEEGARYGWPYVYADGQINPQDYPKQGTVGEWAEASNEPLLMYTPHAAPMQMAFYEGDAFPEEFRGDAFLPMRGSWNRKPPSGYEIVRVRFENGEPQAVEPFITGFLIEDGENWQQMGRLAGLAFGPDGSMYVSDDTNGVMYRITYEGNAASSTEARPEEPGAN